MIPKKDLEKLKNILEKASNPFFLFDNDPDGICSAAILFKNIRKGNFFVLRSLNIGSKLKKKILNGCPSEIFILDKPLFDKEFIEKVSNIGAKTIFIDHHQQKNDGYSLYFNTYPSSEPVSYITQKIFDSKETRFLSLMGCISDLFIPDFFEEEKRKNFAIFPEEKDPSKILYSTDFGKSIQILSLSLMNNDKAIKDIFNYITKINYYSDILIENETNSFMHKRYNELMTIIEKNIEKAKIFDSLVFLEFSGKYSLSSEIANRLQYLNKGKFIVVCYKSSESINVSLRGKKAKKITEDILKAIENSLGGGHEKACGLKIPILEYEKFKDFIFRRFSISL